ncbi:HAD family hydrolase [Desnuesiella massiliensis]|uniref:HAD family hydrolase n=1 Tax=Desnuesiella massiliensis TaxID=1650662 RepID=UPI0006E16496|nr:HAD family phosphatase [Desnuesiella massiliensis]
MLTDVRAAIFDLDGTLVDSMWIWEKIDIDYLKIRNIDMPEDLRDAISHLSFQETAKYFKNRFNLEDSLEEIMNEWYDMALYEYENNVPLKAGAKLFLDKLKKLGIKIGLATSNSLPLLEIALKKNDIYDYFDAITITGEVKRGKSFPDVYLLAAEKLGVSPDQCIVFEDILPAMKGAKAAGMKVVGVYDELSKDARDEIEDTVDKFIIEYAELNEAV